MTMCSENHPHEETHTILNLAREESEWSPQAHGIGDPERDYNRDQTTLNVWTSNLYPNDASLEHGH